MTLEEAKKEAQRISQEEGVTQHVNQYRDGTYYITDWYNCDTTVCSYTNGIEH